MFNQYKKKLLRMLFLLLATLLAASVPFLAAQQPRLTSAASRSPSGMTLRVDVEMVLVPVAVTDEYARAISGLGRENFEVYENGVRQEVANVVEEDRPISVGLVFDGSGSMANKIDLCKQAVRAFFQYAHPQDEYFLLEFNNRPHLLSRFTSRQDRILSYVGAARGGGSTALYDALYLALDQMQNARHSRKILLLLSDGADNASRYSERDIRSALRESDVQVYTIGVFNPHPYRRAAEEVYGPANLANLAKMSGGRGIVLDNPAYLPDTAAKISRELRTQYEISYYPATRIHNGEWRKLRVKVKAPPGAPPLEVRSRSGYYAPSF